MRYTIAILAILTFASCKKEYTCNCVDKDGNNIASSSSKQSKKDVDNRRTICEGEAAWYTSDYPNKAPITCTLN